MVGRILWHAFQRKCFTALGSCNPQIACELRSFIALTEDSACCLRILSHCRCYADITEKLTSLVYRQTSWSSAPCLLSCMLQICSASSFWKFWKTNFRYQSITSSFISAFTVTLRGSEFWWIRTENDVCEGTHFSTHNLILWVDK